MPHLDDMQRAWHPELPPGEALTRVTDLLLAYGARVTLQSGDFVAAELPRRPSDLLAGLALAIFAPPLFAWRVFRGPAAPVVTAEALPEGTGARITVTASGRRARALAADIARGLDLDRRPVATA